MLSLASFDLHGNHCLTSHYRIPEASQGVCEATQITHTTPHHLTRHTPSLLTGCHVSIYTQCSKYSTLFPVFVAMVTPSPWGNMFMCCLWWQSTQALLRSIHRPGCRGNSQLDVVKLCVCVCLCLCVFACLFKHTVLY